MALLDLQGMTSENATGGNSSLSLFCHSSYSVTICL